MSQSGLKVPTNYREINKILYKLKREKGQPLSLFKVVSGTTDFKTGQKTVTATEYPIARAVILPYTDKEKFSYPLTFIASNKNFSYGGFFDEKQRLVIIDRKDLEVEITTEFRVRIRSEDYEVHTIWMTENESGYLISIARVANTNFASGLGSGLFTELGAEIYTELGDNIYVELT